MWPFVMYIIMKALNGFLMIQRQMTLKIYNVRKFHRTHRPMSDGFLADSVDTTLASLVVQNLR